MTEQEEFTNDPMEVDTLPDISVAPFTPLSTQYAINNKRLSLAITLGLITLLASLNYQPFFTIPPNILNNLLFIVLAIAVIGATHLIYHTLADPLKAYSLREKDITYRSGLIFRKMVTQPMRRVQHVEVEKGPIERMTGLATLQVFSAGGSSFTFAIPGLPENDAMQIRQYILDNKSAFENVLEPTNNMQPPAIDE